MLVYDSGCRQRQYIFPHWHCPNQKGYLFMNSYIVLKCKCLSRILPPKSTMIYLVMCVFSPLVYTGSYSHCCWLSLWLWCPVHWSVTPAATSSIHKVDTNFFLLLLLFFAFSAMYWTDNIVPLTVHDCYTEQQIDNAFVENAGLLASLLYSSLVPRPLSKGVWARD